MLYFPINLDIRGKRVVVVGGGEVACRKCRLLLRAGARVTVIAPRVAPGFHRLAAEGTVQHLERPYEPGDLAGALLVFAATSDHAVNRMVADEARAGGILANIADAPGLGAFTLPATLSRGDLLITVSTAGKSPTFARTIRDRLATEFGPEYADVVELLGVIREKLLTGKGETAYNDEVLSEFMTHDLPALVKNRVTDEVDNLLLRLFGPDYTLANLGLREKDHP